MFTSFAKTSFSELTEHLFCCRTKSLFRVAVAAAVLLMAVPRLRLVVLEDLLLELPEPVVAAELTEEEERTDRLLPSLELSRIAKSRLLLLPVCGPFHFSVSDRAWKR